MARAPPARGRSGAWAAARLGDGEDGLGLGELRRAHDHGLAALVLEQGGLGVGVLAGLVELDRPLRQDVVGEVGRGQRLAELRAVGVAGPLQRVGRTIVALYAWTEWEDIGELKRFWYASMTRLARSLCGLCQ